MKERKRRILGDLEALRFASSIDAAALSRSASEMADAVEFYLDSSPHRVDAIVVTEKNASSSSDQKREHRILFKVRFKRRENLEQGTRKTALVLPSTKDAFASVLGSVSGADLRLCGIVAAAFQPEYVQARRAETSAEIRRLVRGYSESHFGAQNIRDLMKWAVDKTRNEIDEELQRVMATAVANGFTEEQVVTALRNAVVKDVMRK
jgi:hypothetical protein